MNDSTHDKARQLAREFKIGITFLAVLFVIFVGVVYRRYRMSFVEPPSKFVAQTTSESRDESPAYRNPQDYVIQSTPSILPPPSDFRARNPIREAPPNNEVSGGSFQPIASSEHHQVEVEEPLIPPSPPSGGTFDPTPPVNPPSAPNVGSPTPIELAPPALTEPATFEQHPEETQSVRRTEFVNSEPKNEMPESNQELRSEPPMTLAIDSTSKPIDQSTRVEPIRAGDSFWLIAQRAYGTGGYFRALYEHNRESFPEPDKLPVGAQVEIPSTANLRERFREFCPKECESSPTHSPVSAASDAQRFYTVVGGESLFDVARFQLGQGSRYVEILDLNRDALDENREALPAGLKLRLPQK